jgi:hypothetical protein
MEAYYVLGLFRTTLKRNDDFDTKRKNNGNSQWEENRDDINCNLD